MSGSLRALAILLGILLAVCLTVGATVGAVACGVALLVLAGLALEEAGS